MDVATIGIFIPTVLSMLAAIGALLKIRPEVDTLQVNAANVNVTASLALLERLQAEVQRLDFELNEVRKELHTVRLERDTMQRENERLRRTVLDLGGKVTELERTIDSP